MSVITVWTPCNTKLYFTSFLSSMINVRLSVTWSGLVLGFWSSVVTISQNNDISIVKITFYLFDWVSWEYWQIHKKISSVICIHDILNRLFLSVWFILSWFNFFFQDLVLYNGFQLIFLISWLNFRLITSNNIKPWQWTSKFIQGLSE